MNSVETDVTADGYYTVAAARKKMAAGALCRDEVGRILLVDPVYRDTWDIPGGVVEAAESPHAACRREVAEEVGLDRQPGRILVVDWVPAQPDGPEEVVVIYDGGILSPADLATITVPSDELAGFMLAEAGQVKSLVRPVVAGRIAACLEALASGAVEALENGRRPALVFSPRPRPQPGSGQYQSTHGYSRTARSVIAAVQPENCRP